MKLMKKLKFHIYLPILGFLFMLMTNPDNGGLLTHGYITAYGIGYAGGYMFFLPVGIPFIVFAIGKIFKKNFFEGTKNWVIILSMFYILLYFFNTFYPAYY